MKVTKVLNALSPGALHLGNLSAVWECQDLPGVWVRQAEITPRGSAWKVFASPNQVHQDNTSNHIIKQLENQRFTTRREALQAVQAAWLVASLRSGSSLAGSRLSKN